MENNKLLDELKSQNQLLKDLFIFSLCKEGYNDAEIRAIFGKVDNNRIRKISSGLKRVKTNKK